MVVIAALEAIALVVVVWLLLRHHSALEGAWTVERRELLTRIQRPEHTPTVGPIGPYLVPEPEPDEVDLVGTIAHLEE